jgi:hypothetical protein
MIGVVWVERLHHKRGREGHMVLLTSCVYLHDTDPVFSDDTIPGGWRGWSPADYKGRRTDYGHVDVLWWLGRSYRETKRDKKSYAPGSDIPLTLYHKDRVRGHGEQAWIGLAKLGPTAYKHEESRNV